jgi:hypothetical protein
MLSRLWKFSSPFSHNYGALKFRLCWKKDMKAAMILLSFVIGYPVFMMFVYLVAKVIFTPLDKIAAEQEKERFMLLMRARRVRKKERLVHA